MASVWRSFKMPLYTYRCDDCELSFERLTSSEKRNTQPCPECEGIARREPAAPAVRFNGSGWQTPRPYGNT